MITSTFRGHEIVFDDVWRFTNTGESTVDTWESRPCGHCGRDNTSEGYDACLGTLPGVMNACCGHGEVKGAYVHFDDGSCIRGYAALAFIEEL